MRPRRALLALFPLALSVAAGIGCPARKARAFPTWGLAPVNTLVLTSVTSGSSAGDTVTFLGSGFSEPAVTIVTPATGALTPAAAVTQSSAMGAITTPPLGAGTYDLFFQNQGGAMLYAAGALSITSVATLSSIYGGPTHLLADYPANLATCSGTCVEGSTVTGLTDASGNGNNATCSGAVLYHPVESRWLMPNQPSVEFSAASAYCEVTSFSLGGAQTLYMVGAFNVTTDGTPDWLALYNSPYLSWRNANPGVFQTTYNGGTDVATNTKPGALNVNYIGIGGGAYASSSITMASSVNNAAAVTNSYSASAPAASGPLSIGNYAASDSAIFYTPRIAFVNVVPNSTQSLQTAELLNLSYGITPAPSLSYMTPTLAACSAGVTCYGRVQGTNFEPGMTITASGGIGALTMGTVAASGLYADVQIPTTAGVGSYGMTLANPDGRSASFPSSLPVGTVTNPETFLGPYLSGWWEGSWACTGGCAAGNNVSESFDLSGLGNNFVQGTTADQPKVNSLADILYNGAPTLVSSGSPVTFVNSSQVTDSSNSGFYLASTWKSASTAGGKTLFEITSPSSSSIQMIPSNGSGNPETTFETTTATWGSSTGTTLAHYLVARGTGSGTFTVGHDVNDDGSSEVTTTGSATPTYAANTAVFFSASGGGGAASGTTGLAVFVSEDLSGSAASLKMLCQYAQSRQITAAVCP